MEDSRYNAIAPTVRAYAAQMNDEQLSQLIDDLTDIRNNNNLDANSGESEPTED